MNLLALGVVVGISKFGRGVQKRVRPTFTVLLLGYSSKPSILLSDSGLLLLFIARRS